jgi:hypothetical protein
MFIFFTTGHNKNAKIIGAHSESTDLIMKVPQWSIPFLILLVLLFFSFFLFPCRSTRQRLIKKRYPKAAHLLNIVNMSLTKLLIIPGQGEFGYY